MKKISILTLFILFFACIENSSEQQNHKDVSKISVNPIETTQKIEADTITIKNELADLLLVRETFDPKAHSISPDKSKIDGKGFFGGDYSIPKYKLSEAYVIQDGHKISLNVEGMYNPWFKDTSYVQKTFRFTETNKGIEIFGVFSDAAGSYAAEWIISEKTAKRLQIGIEDEFLYKYDDIEY